MSRLNKALPFRCTAEHLRRLEHWALERKWTKGQVIRYLIMNGEAIMGSDPDTSEGEPGRLWGAAEK